MEQPHSEYPLMSILFTAMSVYTYFLSLDLQTFDNTYLLPFAHLVTICSGSVAVCLGLISILDKFYKPRKKK